MEEQTSNMFRCHIETKPIITCFTSANHAVNSGRLVL